MFFFNEEMGVFGELVKIEDERWFFVVVFKK